MALSKQFLILEETSLQQRGPTAIACGGSSGDTFHRAIGPVLCLGQFFGLMPLIGVLGKNYKYLKFKWICWRMLHTMITLAGGSFFLCLCIWRFYLSGVDIHNVGMAVFYGSTFLTQVLFLRLGIRWPRVAAAIAKEETMRPPRQGSKHRTLKTRLNICSFLVLFLALVEHLMSILSGVIVVWGCEKEKSVIEGFYRSSYPQIFAHTDYKLWKAAILQVLNFIATFNWNFMDLFIILVSLGLSDRFEHINECLDASNGKGLPDHFWRTTRAGYAHLARLVSTVDGVTNGIVLLSFSCNLYIICLQLFNSLRSVQDVSDPCVKSVDGGFTTGIYFLFSFGFLMSRFLAVSLSASRIHVCSRKPLQALYAVPSECYSIEVSRFLEQVTTDTVALTGLNFFYITRGLILTIAGTVVTYELVLVQFNSPPPTVSANISLNDTCGLSLQSTPAPLQN